MPSVSSSCAICSLAPLLHPSSALLLCSPWFCSATRYGAFCSFVCAICVPALSRSFLMCFSSLHWLHYSVLPILWGPRCFYATVFISDMRPGGDIDCGYSTPQRPNQATQPTAGQREKKLRC